MLSVAWAVVTIAATLTFAGFVYYSFVYREDGERSVEYVAGDPYWSRRDDLFVRGEDKLRDSLRRQGESGGPLLVVLEDESASSKRLRDHIWSDGIVQNLLRGRGGETSRRALRFPPIAVRVHVNEVRVISRISYSFPYRHTSHHRMTVRL